MACPLGADRHFGPRVNPNCRNFDFTVDFEDVVFACVPAAIFLVLLPSTLVALLRVSTRYQRRTTLLFTRLTAYVGLFAAQLALLILRVRHASGQISTSVAADSLLLVTIPAAAALSVITEQRSLRPSTILALYFTAVIILGIARVRTFWLIKAGSPSAATAIAALVLAGVVMYLESTQRKRQSSDDEKANAPEQYSGFWTRVVFAWLAKTFRNGYVKVISVDDLPVLDARLESSLLHRELVSVYHTYDHKIQYSLVRASFRANISTFAAAIIPRLCLTAFTFAQPFLIDTTVKCIGENSPDPCYGGFLIGAWVLVFLGMAVSNSMYLYHSTRFGTKVRGGLMALIYQNVLRIRAVDSGDITAVALMGTDIDRITTSFSSSLHQVWASTIDIGIAVWLLERQLGLACIAPIVLIAIFVGATFFLSTAMRHAQQRWIEMVQGRLRVTSHLLDEIKSVKMLGLERSVGDIIQGLRLKEIKTSEVYRKLLIIMLLLSNTPINLAPIVTFAVYTVITVVTKDTTLLTARAFTSLALIALLTTPVVLLIQSLPMAYETLGNFDRIQNYCRYGAGDNVTQATQAGRIDITHGSLNLDTLTSTPGASSQETSQDDSFSIKARGIAWSQDQTAVFEELNIMFARGKVTAIVGPVGCGKSTLLGTVLGETMTDEERRGSSLPPIAYCSQQPWLEHATVRQNIVGVAPFDSKWYDTVIDCCGLRSDLASLRKGDQTLVGSKGLMLSGGQKQRIALARAVYSKRTIVVLDDILSGMDIYTMKTVATRLLAHDGLFRRHGITVLLATHSRHIMGFADSIFALDDGRVQEAGEPAMLLQGSGHVSRLGLKLEQGEEGQTASENAEGKGGETVVPTGTASEEAAAQLSEDLRRKHGDLSVYKYYARSAGYVSAVIFLCCGSLCMFCTEFPAIWLKWWAEANALHPNKDIGYYIGVFAMFGVVGTILACIFAWFAFIKLISNSALSMHRDLLDSALGAPFYFFTSTDTGELTNRFGQDMNLIDMQLPVDLCNYWITAATCIAKVIIIVTTSKYFGVALPIIATILYFLQRFYLQTSRQIRLLSIEARAPLYRNFIESVAGAATIRAFCWQAGFEERNHHLIDTSQRPEYILQCVQHWLSFVLDMIVTVIAVVLATIVITWKDEIGPGSAGVSLVMVVGFNQVLQRLIKSWTSMEASIGAVARVRRFLDDTPAEVSEKAICAPLQWPAVGQVEFRGLIASHKPAAEPTLKDVTFLVEPRKHIAICGRSGSGKTSLILSLLRMMMIQGGKILIDGVDISTMSPGAVREMINVVSQDPLLLPETLRFNLDPLAMASDSSIRRALEKVSLWNTVAAQGGLEKEMDVSAWSAGQRQLLCLARAIVRTSKILILDEAMSNVDDETERIMQEIIDIEFRDCTVLAILHRLRFIDRYDEVAVLEDGALVEYGKPTALAECETRFADFSRAKTK